MSVTVIAASAEEPLLNVRRVGQPKIAGAPEERGQVQYLSADGQFASGIWEGDAGRYEIASYPVDEMCVLLSGRLIVSAAGGEERTIGPGEAFVIPQGFTGSWILLEPCRKLFATYGTTEVVRFITGGRRNQKKGVAR